jgi:hypothetical protein
MSGYQGCAKLCIEAALTGEGGSPWPASGSKRGDRAIKRQADGFRVCNHGNARQNVARSANHLACRHPMRQRLARRQEISHNSINLLDYGQKISAKWITRIDQNDTGVASADPAKALPLHSMQRQRRERIGAGLPRRRGS